MVHISPPSRFLWWVHLEASCVASLRAYGWSVAQTDVITSVLSSVGDEQRDGHREVTVQ